MKKLIIILIIVANIIIGCTSDTTKAVENNTEQFATFNAKFRQANSLTRKSVKRGLLPTTINKIIITTSKDNSGYLYYDFDLVDNNIDADSTFILRNITTGNIKFVAETAASNSNISKKYLNNIQGHGMIFKVSELNRKLDSLSSEEPYMRFKSKLPITREVIAGANSDLEFEMIPVNGKSIAFFKMSDELISLGCTFDVMQNPYNNWYGGEVKTSSDKCIALVANPQVIPFDQGGQFVRNNGGATGENGIYTTMWYMIRVWDNEGILVKDDKFAITLIAGTLINSIFTITSANSILPSRTETTFDFPTIVNAPIIVEDK